MRVLLIILFSVAAILVLSLVTIGLFKATHKKSNSDPSTNSKFTLLAWILPPAVAIISFFIIPFIIGEAGDFFMMIFMGFAAISILITATGGLILGILALLKKEPFCRAAWVPIILSSLVIVGIALLFNDTTETSLSHYDWSTIKQEVFVRNPYSIDEFRELKEEEITFLRSILNKFRPELIDQINELNITGRCGCGECPTILFKNHNSNQKEELSLLGYDETGIPIGVVLYSYEGKLSELEFWSPTGEHYESYPNIETLEDINPNQRVDPIVKTSGDEVEAQGTQGHP